MIRRRPTSLDQLVLKLFFPAMSRAGAFQRSDLFNDDRIDDQFRFWHVLGWAWVVAAPALCIVWLGLLVVLHCVHVAGYQSGAQFLVFVGVFGIAGGVDAFWRLLCVSNARERYRLNGKNLNETIVRTLRWSQVNDGTIALQLLAGIAIAAYAG